MATFRVGSGEYTVSGAVGEVPTIYAALIEHATLHDDFGLKAPDGTTLVIAVERGSGQWPDLLISQRWIQAPKRGSIQARSSSPKRASSSWVPELAF
jgi:hypothetical protein